MAEISTATNTSDPIVTREDHASTIVSAPVPVILETVEVSDQILQTSEASDEIVAEVEMAVIEEEDPLSEAVEEVVAREEIVAVSSEENVAEIYRVPTRPKSWLFRILFGLAAIVVGVCNVTIKQLLLPAQVAHFYPTDPTNKVFWFSLIAAVGALAGVLISPITGALSDRTVSRLGRRRPWIIFGIIFAVAGLVTMALATNIYQVLVGEIVVQISIDTILSMVSAIIPDQIPMKQRATASAFVGMSPIVGGLIGLLLVSRFTDVIKHPEQGYYVLAAASTVFVLLFLTVFRDAPLPREARPAFHFAKFVTSFWVNPKKYPDFGFVWLSRCLMFLGYTILITYMLYYLQDVIHFQGADKGVAIFQAASTVTLLISAIVGGIFADKTQKLKPFVSWSAIVMALALFVIAFVPSWPVMLAAGIVLGMGFGVYLAVDLALAVRVLPTADARGKDLGLINTAIFIPLIISPLVGAFILNIFHSYSALFAIAAVSLLLAGLFILPVKGVR